jgi:hypothetical protein
MLPKFFLASSDPKNFFIPRSSPSSPIRNAPLVALSNPYNIYSPLSWYDAENAYPSPIKTYEAALTIVESEEDIIEVRTSPGYAWTNARSGFRAAYS